MAKIRLKDLQCGEHFTTINLQGVWAKGVSASNYGSTFNCISSDTGEHRKLVGNLIVKKVY